MRPVSSAVTRLSAVSLTFSPNTLLMSPLVISALCPCWILLSLSLRVFALTIFSTLAVLRFNIPEVYSYISIFLRSPLWFSSSVRSASDDLILSSCYTLTLIILSSPVCVFWIVHITACHVISLLPTCSSLNKRKTWFILVMPKNSA